MLLRWLALFGVSANAECLIPQLTIDNVSIPQSFGQVLGEVNVKNRAVLSINVTFGQASITGKWRNLIHVGSLEKYRNPSLYLGKRCGSRQKRWTRG